MVQAVQGTTSTGWVLPRNLKKLSVELGEWKASLVDFASYEI